MVTVSSLHQDDPQRIVGVVDLEESGSLGQQLRFEGRYDRDEGGNAVAILRIDGELDAHSAAEVREVCGWFVGGFDRVRIDLSAVSFIDGAGIRLLDECRSEVERRGGECHYSNPSPAVQRLFAILGLDSLDRP